MTFTEAALQVLRSAGEPLHYKKIVELAIARNLLSHVGRTPEVTMSSRLATLVKKDRGQSAVVKVRPGVFAIRESSMTEKEAPPSSAAEENNHAAQPPAPPKVQLPGSDVFPEEEGDDDPILAGIEEGGAGGGTQDERGRRKRRRRRGRGGERDGGESPREGEGAPREIVAREGAGREGAGREGAGREGAGREGAGRDDNGNPRGGPERGRDDRGRDRDRGRDDRGPNRDRGRDDRGRDRDRGRDDRGRDRDRGRDDRPRDDRGRDDRDRGREEPRPPIELTRVPAEGDLLGKDLADAAHSVLIGGDRQSASFARVAEFLVRRGRLNGVPDVLAPTVAAAIRGDIARAHKAGRRARFRIVEQRVTLTDWLLPREALSAEDQALQAADRQRDQVRRSFVMRLNDLPTGGFAELVATWLNAEGVTGLRAVRRPTSSGRELHFAGTLRRGAEDVRIGFVVLRAGLDVEPSHLTDVRGSLHHYGSAHQGWIVTTGRVSPQARDEGAAEGAAPCALLSGQDLARSMERLGIGLRAQTFPMSDIDFELLEALGDAGLRRDRDRERSRERDEQQQRAREEQRQRRPEGEGERDDDGSRGPRDVVAPSIDLLDPEAAAASRLGGGEWGGDSADANGAPSAAEGEEAEAAGEDVEIDFDRDEPADEIDDGSDEDGGDDGDDDGDGEESEDGDGDDDGDDDGDEAADTDDGEDEGR